VDYLPKVRYVCIIYIINKLHIYCLFLLENPGGKQKSQNIYVNTKRKLSIYYAYNRKIYLLFICGPIKHKFRIIRISQAFVLPSPQLLRIIESIQYSEKYEVAW